MAASEVGPDCNAFPQLCMALLAIDDDDEEEEEANCVASINSVITLMTDMIRSHGKHNPSFSQFFDSIDELEFFQQLRLSRAAFDHLYSLLEVHEQVTAARSGKEKIPLLERLHVTLWYLANKTTFRETSVQFRLSISLTHKIFYLTVRQILDVTYKIITWPTNIEETAREFQRIAGFPGVIGAIDATHIQICPPSTQHNEYLDRTIKHSVILLAVCDTKKKFTYISTGYAGSIHDKRCFSLTALGQAVSSVPNEYFPRPDIHIVGDSAFTLQSGLMVPFKDFGTLTNGQLLYNHKLSKTRCIVENSFAFLKNRFRCLMKLEVDLVNVMPIIVACCTLHNIALSHQDYLQESLTHESLDSGSSNFAVADVPINPNAAAKRLAICSMF